MKPERWQRIQSLFDRALEMDPARRSVFLELHCADDRALRAEIDALLRAEQAAGSGEFLDAAIGSAAAGLEQAMKTGIRLDEYRLVRELGSGGMGSVWLAERADGEYSAFVAIKLVRGGFTDPEIERRFRVERQILADLAHPNIARLVDGGTAPDGMPYIVMEYVDGQPITHWARENRLSLQRRVHLFLTVCDAVQHAHRSLIVHRDLKPSNILVTTDGQPKLVDFGIAKMLSPLPGATQTVSLVRPMTPWYASPEQIAGDRITVGTDVYSLGVLLYEMLTGTHPFRGERASFLEVRRRILEDAPVPPSEAAAGRDAQPDVSPASLRGDLDAIVLRAIQKAPEQRYASVADLAGDLRRFLDREPIAARSDSPRYRLSRLVGRYAATVGLGIAAVALAAVLTGIGAISLLRQRDRALASAGIADDAARALVTTLRARERAEPRAPDEAVRDAAVLTTFARNLLDRGNATDAETVARESLALLEAAAPADASPVARAHALLGAALAAQQRFDGAEPHLVTALELLSDAPDADPAALHDARESLAALLDATGRADEAARVRAGRLD